MKGKVYGQEIDGVFEHERFGTVIIYKALRCVENKTSMNDGTRDILLFVVTHIPGANVWGKFHVVKRMGNLSYC